MCAAAAAAAAPCVLRQQQAAQAPSAQPSLASRLCGRALQVKPVIVGCLVLLEVVLIKQATRMPSYVYLHQAAPLLPVRLGCLSSATLSATPVVISCKQCVMCVCCRCHRYGADPDVLSPKGWSPLSYAKARGKYGPTEEKGIYPEVCTCRE
jgi:hypothetical protein